MHRSRLLQVTAAMLDKADKEMAALLAEAYNGHEGDAEFPLSEHLTARAMQVTAATHDEADKEMAAMLAGAYEDVKAMLTRNRGALDLAIDALLEQTTLSGAEVRHRKQQAASCSLANSTQTGKDRVLRACRTRAA